MSRPVLRERTEYRPNLPVEAFIVPLLREHIERVLGSLACGPLNFLDMGCGGQPFRPMVEAMGHRYVGADAQDPLGVVDHVMVLDGAIPGALLERGPFDFVLCTEVMEHVADWGTAFANLRRLLRPGGRLLITCPHFYVLHEQPYDFWRPTVFALQAYAARHGFRELRVEALGDWCDVLGTLLGASHRMVRPASSRFLDRLLAHLAQRALDALYGALKRRAVQRHLRLGDERYPVYLSNLAFLERA
jgi:SAM-dependent methyltransferase